MGGCCSDASEERVPLRQRQAIRIDTLTPSSIHVELHVASTVTLSIDAPEDKGRTIEVSFLNADDKKKFEEALNGAFSSRYLPKNDLSLPKWKTANRATLSGTFPEGHYWIVLRSSSKISDKSVHITGTFTSNPADSKR